MSKLVNDRWGFLVIWEFRVRRGMKKRFEKEYGPWGDWARLFRQDKQYLGTQLIQGFNSRSTYLTLDFWTSRLAYERFRRRHAAEYKVIDARCEGLTESERQIGAYVRPRGSKG